MIISIARSTPKGEGNFHFVATAFVPSAILFFPAAHFDSIRTFVIGLESKEILLETFKASKDIYIAENKLKINTEEVLWLVQKFAQELV